MRIKKSSIKFMQNKTMDLKKRMGINAPVKVTFEQLPLDIDANTTPYYSVDEKTGRAYNFFFHIKYNTSFISANESNLNSDGIKGAIVHELCHCKHFMKDRDGYNKRPHTDPYFKNCIHQFMKGDGRNDYQDAYRPDVKVAAAMGRKNSVAPSWLAHFWLYACPKCGFVDAFVTDLRSTSPKCEKCGHSEPHAIHLSVQEAAKLNVAAEKATASIKGQSERDKALLKIMSDYLKKHLTQKSVMTEVMKKKGYSAPVKKSKMKRKAAPAAARKPVPSRPKADVLRVKRNL